MIPDVYHDGETAVQERLGLRDVALMNAGGIATAIPAAAIAFVAKQRLCALAWTDKAGYPWAQLISDRPGYMSKSDAAALDMHLSEDTEASLAWSPLAAAEEGDPIAFLVIDLSTRRRLRGSGKLSKRSPGCLTIAVEQAYPNCPKYIQRRKGEELEFSPAQHVSSGQFITNELHRLILGADTFFVASTHPDGSADASHRGGPVGFLRIRDGAIHVPDYHGNAMFNTLGNMTLNPRAGLSIIDFNADHQVMLTGKVEIVFDRSDEVDVTGGTGRWWVFSPKQWVIVPLGLPMAWQFIDASPFNP
jgi:uncharacterized protein